MFFLVGGFDFIVLLFVVVVFCCWVWCCLWDLCGWFCVFGCLTCFQCFICLVGCFCGFFFLFVWWC